MSIDKDVTKLNWDELLRSFGNSAENEGSLRQEIDGRIARLEKIEAAAKALLNDFRHPVEQYEAAFRECATSRLGTSGPPSLLKSRRQPPPTVFKSAV
jgi:hypothetical protein